MKMLQKIQEIFQAYKIMADPTREESEIASKRLEICNSCEFRVEKNLAIDKIKVCGKCGCVLAAKAFSKDKSACPEGKWEK